MFCKECGNGIKPNAVICVNCGVATNASNQKLEYAGFWKRFAACFIDSIIAAFPAGIAGVVIGFSMAWNDPYIDDFDVTIAGYIIGMITQWLYFAIFESSSYQATPGKMALGIKVTNESGDKISFGNASGRYFGKILSYIILCIGYLMVAFTTKKQGLHDIMAETLVINKH